MSGGDSDPGDPRVVLVAAVAENGVIGDDGGMPWHYPADLQHFKQTTTGHPVVMGRLTYESIVTDLGTPLPNRTNVVLSTRDLDLPEGAVHADSLSRALSLARDAPGGDTVYVVGGATVYEQFFDRADAMVLTEVPESPDGDTEFPAFDAEEWVETDRTTAGELSFVTYERPR